MKVQPRPTHRSGKYQLPVLVQLPAPFEVCGRVGELLKRIRRWPVPGSLGGNLSELFAVVGAGFIPGGANGLVGIRSQSQNGVVLLFGLRSLPQQVKHFACPQVGPPLHQRRRGRLHRRALIGAGRFLQLALTAGGFAQAVVGHFKMGIGIVATRCGSPLQQRLVGRDGAHSLAGILQQIGLLQTQIENCADTGAPDR